MNTTNETLSFEICKNPEWLENHCGCIPSAEGTGCTEKELAGAFTDVLIRELESRFPGCEIDWPKGSRSLYHGWNGANTFAHKLGPVGTFSRLTDSQIEAVHAAVDAASEEVARMAAPVDDET